MLKTTAHRGQGLRLVSSEELLRAEGGAEADAPLAHMLRQPDAVLQRYAHPNPHPDPDPDPNPNLYPDPNPHPNRNLNPNPNQVGEPGLITTPPG